MAVSAGRAEILLWPLFADMVIKSMIQIRTYEDRVTPRVLHPYHKFSRVCRPSVCSNRKTIDACLVLWLMYVGRSSAVDALMLHAYAARVCWFVDGCTRHGAPLPLILDPVCAACAGVSARIYGQRLELVEGTSPRELPCHCIDTAGKPSEARRSFMPSVSQLRRCLSLSSASPRSWCAQVQRHCSWSWESICVLWAATLKTCR
jgi:hypothetical protein